MSDQRYLDEEQARLGGEAAGQEREPDHPGFPAPEGTDHRRPSEAVGHASPTYYDQPVIKEPVWIWSVPAYFYSGGAAAGAALIGAVAQLLDGAGYDDLIRRCRRIAAAGTTVGTAFLVYDLGRPERFLNMLRVFRPTSAISMGSWTLAAASGASGASVVLGRGALGDLAGLAAGLLSPVLGTYTAVLVSDTAVPAYQAAHRELPALFGASAVASATDLLDLGPLDDRSERVSRRIGIAAKAGELAAAMAVEQAADEVERVGRPFHEGASGSLWQASKVLTAASLAVSLLPARGRLRVVRRLVSAVLGSVAAISSRYALFQIGKASARDPRATFERQRAGHAAAAVHGRAAVTGPDGHRATGGVPSGTEG